MPSRSIILKAPVYTAIITMSLLFLALYYGWLGAPSGYGAHFCEADRDALIRQPVNTWSNLGFLFMGLLIAWKQYDGRNNYSNPFNNGLFFSTYLATIFVLVCPGSMAMHASTTVVGGFLDVFSMLLVSSFMAAYAMMRVFKWGYKQFTTAYFIMLTVSTTLHVIHFKVPILGHSGVLAHTFLMLFAGALEHWYYFIQKAKISLAWGYASICTMLGAFVIWSQSITGSPYCDPSSLVQGHGLWHLLSALSGYWLYRYYISENMELKA